MKEIAILASGNGSNAQAIINYFKQNKNVNLGLIASNNARAFVLERAKDENIPCFSFNKNDFFDTDKVLFQLLQAKIDLIVLAGFLWKIPQNLLQHFPNKIINIHPALLPKYGGKGMYGMKVHQEVIKNEELESGITIHYVNENYDEGQIIFSAKCPVARHDTPEMLASKIHTLEHLYYPKTIERLLAF